MYEKEYKKWLNNKTLNEELKTELRKMNNKEAEDAFYKNLEFGTGGMRGVIGAGINRMNTYTIRKANYGFGKYLSTHYKNELSRGVVIAYDNRFKSVEFAKESACVLASLGIKSYLFENLRPTPELSFAVRQLNAIGGIVVTASHNPPRYNGYKIYDEDGCQLVPRYADEVIKYVDEVEDVFNIDYIDYDKGIEDGLITIIGKEIDEKYLKQVDTVQLNRNLKKDICIVFTPLHGTSAILGLKSLVRNNYKVIPVKEQMIPDPNFSTLSSPNPENKESFEYAIKYGKEHNAQLLIATDPDADRLGVACLHNDEYILLTGNQTGAIMLEYILKTRKEQGTLPRKGMVFNTIVTSELGAVIAKKYAMDVTSTLTGFKFIGEQAKLLENTDYEFVFGYEESYGYVIKDFVRDKDSIQALLLISEVANKLLLEGKTLYDKLLDLYSEFGYYIEDLTNIQLEGVIGENRIKEIMNYFRLNKPTIINELEVVKVEDYNKSIKYENNLETVINLPKSNVLKFILIDGSWVALRPSGTEPKLKIYIGVLDKNLNLSKKKNELIKKAVLNIIDTIWLK